LPTFLTDYLSYLTFKQNGNEYIILSVKTGGRIVNGECNVFTFLNLLL